MAYFPHQALGKMLERVTPENTLWEPGSLSLWSSAEKAQMCLCPLPVNTAMTAGLFKEEVT